MTELVVTAPARLHFGMLDPAGAAARRFGGVGVGVEHPRVVVAVCERRGDGVVVDGSQAARAAVFARRCWTAFGLTGGARVSVLEAIPPHMGLGSGTKLGLAIARALAELAGIAAGPGELADASGRGARSSVGCWTFAAPGLVVEGGVHDEGACLSPLLARHAMPERWRCVLALPLGAQGLAGGAEKRVFGELEGVQTRESSVSRLVLTALLPGLVQRDIEEFGAALTQIQREVGSLFEQPQGGVYHPRAAPLVHALLELGVTGVGQSSWGPAVYGIVDGPDAAVEVAVRLRETAAADTRVSVVDFDRAGAQVQRRERAVASS